MATKRKTIKQEPLETLDQVNDVLKQLGIIEMELEEIDNDATRRANQIKAEAAEKMKEKKKQVKAYEKQIDAYLRANEPQFKVKRSVQLTFGKIGLKKSGGAIVTLAKWTFAKAIEQIEKKGTKEQKSTWIERKPSLSKSQILKDYRKGVVTDKQLSRLGLAYDDSDNPYWEPDRTQLKKLAA